MCRDLVGSVKIARPGRKLHVTTTQEGFWYRDDDDDTDSSKSRRDENWKRKLWKTGNPGGVDKGAGLKRDGRGQEMKFVDVLESWSFCSNIGKRHLYLLPCMG